MKERAIRKTTNNVQTINMETIEEMKKSIWIGVERGPQHETAPDSEQQRKSELQWRCPELEGTHTGVWAMSGILDHGRWGCVSEASVAKPGERDGEGRSLYPMSRAQRAVVAGILPAILVMFSLLCCTSAQNQFNFPHSASLLQGHPPIPFCPGCSFQCASTATHNEALPLRTSCLGNEPLK